ncbi:CPBP family intramembrane glutamic endopeptidase [Alicyclobacillus contaminans]|uniref:CPBP family glutamic-type intramembrane protease n=1 Tax=Alicyclobacillus contaminans TaxID=392016 RepID=UPI000409B992
MTALGFHQTVIPHALTLMNVLSLVIPSFYDELLFRNTLQPKFRQWGLSKWMAIGLQSSLYACAVWLGHASLSVALASWLLGWANGWIVYKFRSIRPAFFLGIIWNALWFA